MLPKHADANFDSEMATLAGDEASIIVFLADGFDPAVVRAVFVQVCFLKARSHYPCRGSAISLRRSQKLIKLFCLSIACDRDDFAVIQGREKGVGA